MKKILLGRAKKLPCLKCGKMWMTVPETRICPKCTEMNAGVHDRTVSKGRTGARPKPIHD